MGPRIYPSFQDTDLTSRGSLILTFDELYFPDQIVDDQIIVTVNNNVRTIDYDDIEGLYRTHLFSGDTVSITINTGVSGLRKVIDVRRRDYTCDDVSGNNGIYDTYITGRTGNTSTSMSLTFTVVPPVEGYNFEYRINGRTLVNPFCDITGYAGGYPIVDPSPPADPITINFQYSGKNGLTLSNFWIETNNGYYYYYGPTVTTNLFYEINIDRVVYGSGVFLAAYRTQIFINNILIREVSRNVNQTINGSRFDYSCPYDGVCAAYVSLNPGDNLVITWTDL